MPTRPRFVREISLVVALAVGLAACGEDAPAPAPPPAPPAPPAAVESPTPTPAAEPEAAPSPAAAAPAGPAPATPEGASVSFLTPSDGATIKGALVDGKVNVPVRMRVDGMRLEPAGTVAEGSGHHHVIIDGAPVPRDQIVPADDTHLHFGKAQSDALVPLAPGPHELTLQFADGLHRSYGPDLSATIEVRVLAAPGAATAPGKAPAAADPHAGH